MARMKQTGSKKVKATTTTTKTTATPKAKATVNGAGSPTVQQPAIKSPTQNPVELSDQDRQVVKTWLDDPNTEFKVSTAPLSRKRKRSGTMQAQTDLFQERLSVQYEVKPRDKWECLRRYKKFTVGSESITTGQCILVKHDEGEEAAMDTSGQWKAKVLEVRALDSEHVYIRVAWLNRPEDLATGRKAYHGKFELIPTNQMDIIDAMTVNGPCSVLQWDETDDDTDQLPEDQFFWRQTYDLVGTKTFSDLRKICVCDTPVNPDEMILLCGNDACKKWQHIRCIAEAAVQDAADSAPSSASKTPAKKKPKPKPKQNSSVTIHSNSLAQAKAETDSVTCELMINGHPNGAGQTPADHSYIQLTDADGEKSTKDVQCLFCGTKID